MISHRLDAVFSTIQNGNWTELIENDVDLRIRLVSQGVSNTEDKSTITWDDANLFFLS